MPTDPGDVYCDSLAGSELGVAAFSVPPSLRPRRPWAKRARAVLVAAGLLSAAVAGAYLHSEPELDGSDELRVQGQTLSYSATFAAREGIRTIEVKESAFSPIFSAVGKTTFDPRDIASIDANTLGTVRRVLKYEGDSVKAGDILAEIASPTLARLEAATLLRTGKAPDALPLGISSVRSPLAGTVIERRVLTGQSVSGARVLFVVANLDRLSLDVPIDARQATVLSIGDRVELIREGTGAGVTGHVAELSVGDDGSGSPFSARVAVDNQARHLRPGQTVSARIYASGAARALVIPKRAVAWLAGRPAVFVTTGHNSVRAFPVTLGGDDGDRTAVSVGLVSGEQIVSDGVGALKDESPL